MKRATAERLLGGHATGTLTPEERRILFEAALGHQELFDALMDEEALRELLADPQVRARLLAALAGPGRPLWRRPAALGLAASLFLVVTTSLVLLHRREVPVLLSSAQQAQPGIVPPEAPAPLAAPAAPARPRRAKAAPEPPGGTGAVADQAEAEQSRARELKLEAPAASKAAPPAPPKLAAVPAPEAAKRSLAGAPAEEASALSPVLADLGGGRYRLTVTWAAPGHLYVLKRTLAGTEVLKAESPVRHGAATFLLELGEREVLDVYLLEKPAEDPSALPPSREAPGQWRRVFPR